MTLSGLKKVYWGSGEYTDRPSHHFAQYTGVVVPIMSETSLFFPTLPRNYDRPGHFFPR